MPSEPSYLDLRIATSDDKDRIIQFLRTFFYKDEPINNYIGLVTPQRPINNEAEEFSLINFDQGLSVLAFVDGEVIGVCLCDYIHKKEEEPLPEVEDERFAKLIGLFDRLTKESRIFEKFGDCDTGLVVNVLSVHVSYRRQGIAKKMLKRIRKLGEEKGCGFIKIDCTSHHSAAAAKSLGFKLLYSLNFSDYRVNNEVVFRPESPHFAATVYAQSIG